MMGPYGISLISVGDTNIVANENDFHIVKGITNVTSINGLVRQFNST